MYLLAIVPIFFIIHDAHGLILGHPMEFWDSADIILDGTVISTTKIQADNMVEHNIKVEQYFKNPKPQQVITVYGPDIYNEKWFYPKFFKEGDRVLLYLKKIDGKYIILEQSIAATEKCSPRDMIGLSTLPGEPIGRGGSTLFFVSLPNMQWVSVSCLVSGNNTNAVKAARIWNQKRRHSLQ